MTPEERALIDFLNGRPDLLSTLYDLDLMPEQVIDTKDWPRVMAIVNRFRAAIAEEREACASLATEFCVGVHDGGCPACDVAIAIRART